MYLVSREIVPAGIAGKTENRHHGHACFRPGKGEVKKRRRGRISGNLPGDPFVFHYFRPLSS